MPLKRIKRAFKKITKPVAKVLDKVIPNEIKPFLPYVAAVAPVLGPKLGILSNLTKAQAAGLYGGGALFSQLSQEGSEGDFDILPVLSAATAGYLAQPTQGGIGSLQTSGEAASARLRDLAKTGADLDEVAAFTDVATQPSLGTQLKDFGIEAVRGAEEFIQAPGLGGTAKALGPTISTQVTQDAVNFAKQAEADYLAELEEFNRLAGEQQAASDADRRSAIIASMTRANFAQDIIDETLDQLGLKDGGVVKMKEGGIMDLGGKEMDMRTGGFIPIGAKERADDVPARLSKNEFVMTADAVRAAGGGSVNKGAKRMYDLMDKLEARA